MTDIVDEILSMLEDTPVTADQVHPEVPHPSVDEPSRPVKEPRTYEMADGEKLFSEVFGWEPTSIPNIPVKVFTGYDTAKAPEYYVPPKHEVELFAMAMRLKLLCNVVGPTGSGKDTMIEYYSEKTGRPYCRIDHNQELERSSIFYQTHITDGDTDVVLGILPRAMQEPTIIVLNELSRAPSFALILYQRVFDRRQIAITEAKGEDLIINAHEECLFCAADNTKGNGDDMDLYSASNVLDASTINRIDMILEHDYMTATQEEELIIKMLPSIDPKDATVLAKFSQLMHQGFKKREITTAFSPRNLLSVTKLMGEGMSLQDAVSINFFSRLTESELADARESLRAITG